MDVIDAMSGLTSRTIRVDSGDYLAVNVSFGRYELWTLGGWSVACRECGRAIGEKL